jgi:GT2 family glycosyltransferase
MSDPAAARKQLLARFAEEGPESEALRIRELLPTLDAIQDQERQSVEIEGVVEYGVGSASPSASVVVTLYGRLDFLEHQLLHFSQDPAMRSADLIYVLDSPELSARLAELASALYALHGVPFRIARLTRNAGFSTANNLGASLARGPVLLLLNSDVIPDRPGWLDEMVNFYDATPEIGALGPKLVFEDESLQHAGMYFERDASGLWGNLHYYKGLSRTFPPANINRPVPAVTGACLMIDRALYTEVGGLSHRYIQIGYEDSDLCLRFIARGLRNWYVADVELYHLEGQAYPDPMRVAFTKYNTWRQTHLWGPLIEKTMREEAMEPA